MEDSIGRRSLQAVGCVLAVDAALSALLYFGMTRLNDKIVNHFVPENDI